MPADGIGFDDAAAAAEPILRSVRRLSPREESDFEIVRSDGVIRQVDSIKSILSAAALVIGLITILGSCVALMNIMLVSVRERRREIGARKALGATSGLIALQFLLESALVCLSGGAIGIILGTAVGNAVSAALSIPPCIPWEWIAAAFAICLFAGVASGLIPARRAAELNPIEALKYE
ncbi:MAG: FtsX-like permease family protein [Bacteroidales bacterium]|nr:FtsX-like permease family protein [Bacteroidales bacterium]